MQFSRQAFHYFLQRTLGAIVLVCIVAFHAQAQEIANENVRADATISNFGQMDARFYRGGQPKKEEDYSMLAALGIKTVIDLRADPKKYERPMVERFGMRYVNIPMESKTRPTDDQARAFLQLANDPATGKFFVHCAGGRHRTGAMGAVYRYENYGWNFDQVYAEMKRYDFYTRNRHESYKDFVHDYYGRMRTKGSQEGGTTTTTPPDNDSTETGRGR
jgi:tyrosine-protein phosphatase SIW14